VPRLVALESVAGQHLLIETALVGTPLDAASVRRRPDATCQAVIAWLQAIQPSGGPQSDASWFDALVRPGLDLLASVLGDSASDRGHLDRLQRLVAPLAGTRLPLVLEHGDLSPPNLMQLADNGLGAVDWELAEPRGLPLHDLVFFLGYAGFALHGAAKSGRYVAAYDATLFGPQAWGRVHLLDYASQLGLARQWLTPLVALCWTRYLASLVRRRDQVASAAGVADWLRTNRYYQLWHHTLSNLDRLDWNSNLRPPAPR
jgi:hypothetical protein